MTGETKSQTSGRAAWADFAKGLTIILVVMMHSTLGVELTAGETVVMGGLVDFARAFRMPLFFAISGLFAATAISRGWIRFADAKLIHFAYFYILWSVLQIGVRLALAGHGQHDIGWHQFLLIPIEPFGTIWFIYILPLFFLTAKLTRNLPSGRVILAVALISLFHTDTGWIVADASTKYLIFFMAGLHAGPWLKDLAFWAVKRPLGIAGLAILFTAVNLQVMSWGKVEDPAFALVLGLIGIAAMVGISAVVGAHKLAAPIRYCGQNSLAIYVAFTFPMVAIRLVATKTGIISNPELISIFVTVGAVTGALAMAWCTRRTPLAFFFERPDWVRLRSTNRQAPQPA